MFPPPHLELISDSPGPLVLLLLLAQPCHALLGAQLELRQLGPSVGGERLAQVAHLAPGGREVTMVRRIVDLLSLRTEEVMTMRI